MDKSRILTIKVHLFKRANGHITVNLDTDTKELQEFGVTFFKYDQLGNRIEDAINEVLA